MTEMPTHLQGVQVAKRLRGAENLELVQLYSKLLRYGSARRGSPGSKVAQATRVATAATTSTRSSKLKRL